MKPSEAPWYAWATLAASVAGIITIAVLSFVRCG